MHIAFFCTPSFVHWRDTQEDHRERQDIHRDWANVKAEKLKYIVQL